VVTGPSADEFATVEPIDLANTNNLADIFQDGQTKFNIKNETLQIN
jgi:hypothetical protein